MSILVVGATGFVGGEIARKLAVQKHKVAGLVRGGSAHSKIIAGDLCNSETLVHALKNAETVVCTATSMPSATDNGLQKIDHDGTLTLIELAERQGVKKFVYVSYSANICEESPLETAKRECEHRLLASRMEAVILRPSYFMEMWLSPALGFDPANGSARIYGSGDAKVSYISAMNVADFGVVAALRQYAEENTILEVGGSEPFSQLEVVRIFEEALNKKFKVTHVPTESLQTQHRSSDPLQKTFGALMLAYSEGDVVKQAAETARQHGVELHSVAEYASGFRSATTGVVENQEYTSPFADVHKKATAFKDRVAEASKNDAEIRERRLMQEGKDLGILDKKPD
jgi:NADH dehydrogenase